MVDEAVVGELVRRMEAVEGRLAAIEGLLNWAGARGLERGGAPVAAVAPVGETARTEPRPPVEVRPGVVPPPLPPRVHLQAVPVQAAQETVNQANAQAGVGAPRVPVHIQAGTQLAQKESIEEWVGRNWTSWVGAIVVVLGVCFFLKYAWDAGWLAVPPVGRVWMAIGAGVVFAGAGEWVGRKGMRVLAGTLSGAGVAIGMAACFAAATLFDVPVFSLNGAMVGVAICALAGIGLALRVNAVTVAIIALLGAYAAPAILSTGADKSVELMCYLGAVAVVGWALAYLKGGVWGAVRWVVWGCTVTWMALWLLRFGLMAEHSALAMGAMAFFFAGFVGEAYASLWREMKPFESDDETPIVPSHAAQMLDASLAVMLMMTCAATFAGMYAVLFRFGAGSGLLAMRPAAGVAIGMAVLHALIGLAGPGKQFPRSGWLCAAALVTLAVPLAFGQFAVTLGWLLLAVGLAVLSRGSGKKVVAVWAVVLFGLAVGKLFTLDLLGGRLSGVVVEFDGQKVTKWMMMAWGVGVMGHLMGWVMGGGVPAVVSRAGGTEPPPCPLADSRQDNRSLPPEYRGRVLNGVDTVLAAVGTGVFLVGTGMGIGGDYLNLVALIWTVGLIVAAGRGPRAGRLNEVQCAIILLLVAIHWGAVEGMGRLTGNWNGGSSAVVPVINLSTLVGVGLLGLIGWVARTGREDVKGPAGVGLGVILFALLTFQTMAVMDAMAGSFADLGTAKFVALSVLWGVLGLIAVVAGFAAQLRGLRYAGLGLLAVTLAKILVVDLSSVRPVYRILSFLAVGGLLLCVSFVYHRHPALRKALGEKREG